MAPIIPSGGLPKQTPEAPDTGDPVLTGGLTVKGISTRKLRSGGESVDPSGLKGKGDPSIGPEPQLPAPKLSSMDMSFLLLNVQSKLTEQRFRTGEQSIDANRKQMEALHKLRMDQINTYYEKSEAALDRATGIFGRLLEAIKKAFAGDIEGAVNKTIQAFAENPASACVLALCVATFPSLLSGCVIATMLLNDPAIQKELGDLLGIPRDVMPWLCMGAGIAIAVVKAIAVTVGTLAVTVPASLLAGALVGSLVGPGVGTILGAIAGAAVGAGLSLVIGMSVAIPDAAVGIEGGIRTFSTSQIQAEGLQSSAEADKTQVARLQVQEELQKEMGRIREFMESLASSIQVVMKDLESQFQAQQAAATMYTEA